MSSLNEVDTNPNPRLAPARQLERLIFVLVFFGVVITGFPQKFILYGWADWLIAMLGGIESARILHRFFTLLLTIAVIIRALRIAYQWFVFKNPPEIFLSGSEWRSLFSGMRNQAFSRLPLKVEYWFMVIALIIFAITGAILLNPILIADILPGGLIPIARRIHSDHALLFVLFVIIWRIGIWFVWRPPVFPDSNSEPETGSQEITGRRGAFNIGASIAVIVVAGLLYFYVTYETTAISTVARHEVEAFAPGFVPDTGDVAVGELVWETQRCAFCHGDNAEGGINEAPALPTGNLTFEAFVIQVRNGSNEMPAFSNVELPDSYLVHLWAWLSEK